MKRRTLVWQALVVLAALIFTVWVMYRPGGIVERVSVPPSVTNG